MTALQTEIPGLGETVAFDAKPIYAWVKENNERVYVTERYDKTKCLAGDPDCKLGVKRSTNQDKAETPAPSSSHQKKKKKPASNDSTNPQTQEPPKEKKELIWGYGSGVAAATTPDYGDVIDTNVSVGRCLGRGFNHPSTEPTQAPVVLCQSPLRLIHT